MCLARSDRNERVKVYTRRQILQVLLVTPKRGRSNIEKICEKSQSGGKNTPTNKAALEGTEIIKNFPDFLLSTILIYVMI
jgi:hypothetical protein